MKGCLLCLEILQEFVGSIQVESIKWQELNVQHLIEKHFWPLDAFHGSGSWLCTGCWQELYGFHKFYIRVEAAHAELGLSIKKVELNEIQNEDFKPLIEKVTFDEPQISIKESVDGEPFAEEENVVIKEENDEPLIEGILSLKKNKKAIKVKIASDDDQTVPEDPLSKKKQCRRYITRKPKSSKAKESKILTDKSETKSIPITNTSEQNDVKSDPDLMEINEDGSCNLCSDSDTNYEPDKDIPEKSVKKRNDKPSKSANHANDKFLKENFKINCSLCQIQTETFHALCKHFKTEHKQIGFVICCKKKFYRRSLLVDHVHQHVNPNYFKCTICDKVMADRKCLNMHNKTHNDKKEKVHPCDICNKKFSMYMSLKLHKMSHLSEDEKHVPCTECGKKFASKSLLSNHVRSVHLKKYINICDICGRSIRCKEVFERHMLQHEGKPLPTVTCDVCGLLLANKHSLKQHKLMVHPEGGKKEFTCPVCAKISPNLKAHKKHVQYNHEWGYDHKCTMCEKAFKTAHTLTEHMASHTGTILYTCPWCPKTFNSNANFHSHRKKSHRKEWEEATRKKYSGNLPPNYNTLPASNTKNSDLPIYIMGPHIQTSQSRLENIYCVMEGCILCLEIKEKFADAIVMNSKQWNELNIRNVLDKYFWPMNYIETSSWICNNCWKKLYEFHKFYIRIEETHRNFGLFKTNILEVKKDEVAEIQISELEDNSCDELGEIPVDEFKEFLNEDLQIDLMIEQKPLIKHELNEESLSDKNTVTQKPKRGRPRKGSCNGYALNKTINYEKGKAKQNKAKEVSRNKNALVKKKAISKVNNQEIYHEIHRKQITAKKQPHLSLKNDNDSNNDTDRESLDHNEIKQSIKRYFPPKINHNEKDNFLQANFKITCFLCNIPFETFFDMRKHFDEHHTERGHVKCCNKKFYRRSILVDHVHYHLNPNYFKCSQCGKVMADRRCLELHVEIHESHHEKNHCCDICGKGFAKLGVLKKHRMIHLSEEEKRFSCADCGKNFASNYLLSSHNRSVHLKKYAKICDICGKSIRCKDVFERHMLQHEGKTAPSVSCDVCGLVLTDKKALKRHKGIIHPVGGQHEYTCSICSKISPNLRAHKRHVQYKHVMGYDYKCTICEKAFKRAPTLKEHMASHTGTVLYTCPWCPKTFNSNANMHNHRKRIHPKEWEEASRKRYSGNLPPNYKPPNIIDSAVYTVPMDI